MTAVEIQQQNQRTFVSLKTFLDSYPNNSTRTVYRSALQSFFVDSFGYELPIDTDTNDPSKKIRAKLEDVAINTIKRYFEEKKSDAMLQDLARFQKFLVDQGYPSSTRSQYIATTLNFMEANGVLFSKFHKKAIFRQMQANPSDITIDEPSPFDYDTLWLLWRNLPLVAQAFYAFVLSSGCRKREITTLTHGNAFLDNDPPQIIIQPRFSKTKKGRITFVSQEALTLYKLWSKSQKRGPPFNETDLVFSIPEKTMDRYWSEGIVLSGLDQVNKVNGRKIYHPHSLRSFFISALQDPGMCPYALAHLFAGHSLPSNRGVYDRWSPEKRAQRYKLSEFAVTINCLGAKPNNPSPIIVPKEFQEESVIQQPVQKPTESNKPWSED